MREIHTEACALRQALNLARKDGLLRYVPHVPMLTEDNARQGFFERADFEAIDACLQIQGPDSPLERAVRDARLGPIGGGTDEIMKEILGRSLGL